MSTVNKENYEHQKAVKAAAMFAILADPTRCRIIKLLIEASRTGQCVYEVADAVGLTHSAASHQLNKMEALQIVTCTREGQRMCYGLAETDLALDLVKALEIFYK